MLRLRDSTITAEVFGGPQTTGGNITIPSIRSLSYSRTVRSWPMPLRDGAATSRSRQGCIWPTR
jgi:hypothetical protein